MKLKDILKLINDTAKTNNLSTPYIVGGFSRDIIIKKVEQIKDVDITCGDESSLQIGQQVVAQLPDALLTTFNDKHSKLKYKNFSIDFSSNFRIPNINEILIKTKILNNSNITPIQEELYSRDFTINTLLMPLDLSTIIDLTGKGIPDIQNKNIDTCLSPNITLFYDPKRIVRIIYLAAKLGFYPSDRVIDWVRKNGNMLNNVNEKYTKEKINKALKSNKDLTIKLLKEMNLNSYIPETGLIRNIMVENGKF